MEQATSFGNLIRDGRKKRGLSQRVVAEAVGKSTQAISGWEQGVRHPGNQGEVETLVELLDLDAGLAMALALRGIGWPWFADQMEERKRKEAEEQGDET